MIRKAVAEDIPSLKKITEACARHMIAQGIFQWNEHYPSIAVFKRDIEQENMYAFELDGVLVGCVMLSFEKDEFYDSIPWQTKEQKHLYVHRLAVHPDVQGNGIAQKLMDFGENLAQENGCLSVRLDTFSKNPRNNIFYQKRNYQLTGEVFFEQKNPHPFYCYEKVFDNKD